MALLTSSIGSFPKPPALHEARRRYSDGEIDAAALRQVEDEATRNAVGLQDELGIHLLVDGEMDRGDPITTFAERLAGVESCLDRGNRALDTRMPAFSQRDLVAASRDAAQLGKRQSTRGHGECGHDFSPATAGRAPARARR